MISMELIFSSPQFIVRRAINRLLRRAFYINAFLKEEKNSFGANPSLVTAEHNYSQKEPITSTLYNEHI